MNATGATIDTEALDVRDYRRRQRFFVVDVRFETKCKGGFLTRSRTSSFASAYVSSPWSRSYISLPSNAKKIRRRNSAGSVRNELFL